MDIPRYTATKSREKVIVSGNPKKVRPFVVSAILRDIAFNDETYKSFIDLQDKLHQNVCRMRSLVSIGTHDLDTITFPVHYDARPPNDIQFIALNQKQKLSAEQLMDLYSVSLIKHHLLCAYQLHFPIETTERQPFETLPGDYPRQTCLSRYSRQQRYCSLVPSYHQFGAFKNYPQDKGCFH